jgi:hypothetical protein
MSPWLQLGMERAVIRPLHQRLRSFSTGMLFLRVYDNLVFEHWIWKNGMANALRFTFANPQAPGNPVLCTAHAAMTFRLRRAML